MTAYDKNQKAVARQPSLFANGGPGEEIFLGLTNSIFLEY